MNHDLIEKNETNANSKGGTELLQERLYDGTVPRELLEQFQIVFSRARDLDENRFRIFYAHDLPGDPESDILKNGGYKKFHKLVFVSNWQMQAYINYYKLPWSHCEVIENSIRPLDRHPEADYDGEIRLCYTSTPHRGLHILFAAFDALCKKHENIKLDVFSSFKLYGWDQRDEQFRELFDRLDAHPRVNNWGTMDNEDVREYLEVHGDIFVHPGIWPETSCLCLIEAMSAGLMCVHSNNAALPDTASGFTFMYQMDEDENRHATKLYHILDGAIQHFKTPDIQNRRSFMKMYADNRFHHEVAMNKWTNLLGSIAANNPDKKLPKEMWTYGR